MGYAFPKNSANGTEITLENGVTYKYDSIKNTWGVQGVESQLINKAYIDTAVGGNAVGAGRTFQGYAGQYPTNSNYFTTDAAQPKDVKKIWMHDDFLNMWIEGPGKTFKRGGWIDIHEVSGIRRTLGMYFVYNIAKDSNGHRYFTVHGMSTVNNNLIVGTNYGLDFACSFNSSMASPTNTVVEIPNEDVA